MPYLKQIKTVPNLSDAMGMSARNLRRYKNGELKIKFIKGVYSQAKVDEVFYNAKVGLLIETLSAPKINEMLFIKFDCQKRSIVTAKIQELERLDKIGRFIGSWYFNDNFKKEMVK